jgi:hypothetical protein
MPENLQLGAVTGSFHRVACVHFLAQTYAYKTEPSPGNSNFAVGGWCSVQYRLGPVVNFAGCGIPAMIEIEGSVIRASKHKAYAVGLTSLHGVYRRGM